jgi:hypothetical protein
VSSQVNFNFGSLSIDGFPIEVYRVASGVNGDTAVIAPNRFDLVKAAFGGPTTNDLPTTGAPATNVTFTIRTDANTNPIGTFDVVLVGFQRS